MEARRLTRQTREAVISRVARPLPFMYCKKVPTVERGAAGYLVLVKTKKRSTTMSELVHVPRSVTVYDTTTPVRRAFRFLYRAWSRLRAGLAGQMAAEPHIRRETAKLIRRYRYVGRHLPKPMEDDYARQTHTRLDGTVEETIVIFPATPTFIQKVRHARAQRRNHVPAIKHGTGAFPTVSKDDEDTWSWLTADEWAKAQQRKINNAQIVMSGAEGPLAP